MSLAYDTLPVHRWMLRDRPRMAAFEHAIREHEEFAGSPVAFKVRVRSRDGVREGTCSVMTSSMLAKWTVATTTLTPSCRYSG